MKVFPILFLALTQVMYAGQAGVVLTPTAEGVKIESDAGTFTLVPGNLRLSESDQPGAVPTVSLEGNDTVVAKYPGGSELRMEVDGERISCELVAIPDGAFAYLLSMSIPTSFAPDGKFSFAKLPLQPFPDGNPKEMVSQSVTTQFNLVGPSGAGFTMKSTNGYAQLLDNKSSFNYVYYFRMEEHPGVELFSFEFAPLDPDLEQ